MTASVPGADRPVRPVRRDPIRTVGAGDRAAVLAVVGAVGLFPAEELVEVEQMLDAFLAGTADPGDRWVTDDHGDAAGDDEVIFWKSLAPPP